jgi:hypothetical protein
MKKILALLALLATFPAFGQAVNSDQIKKATDGGIVGDSASAVWVAPKRGTSGPSSPVAGALWCDTNTTPCLMKTWNGSSWVIPLSNGSVPVQTDVSSFPVSPSDGQLFYSKSPKALWVYDGTALVWVAIGYTGYQSGANITDLYTNAAITAPGALTNTASGTAGSTSAGAYSYKVTFRNSTGGETDGGTVSGNASPGASKSNDLSAIPTGGTGTTSRGIYRSKANQNVTGPWWWVATVNDNVTTTLNDGVADASLFLQIPEHNYSGALPGSWVGINTSSSTTSGGCGVSASRGTMICRASASLANTMCNTSVATSEARVGARLDISAYASGNYTVQYRIKQLALSGDTNVGVINPNILSFANGTADNSQRVQYAVGATSSGCNIGPNSVTLPFSSSNHPSMLMSQRTVAAAARSVVVAFNTFPEVDALPMWVRIIKKGNTMTVRLSPDGVNWTPQEICQNANNTTANCGQNAAFGSATTSIEILTSVGNSSGVEQMWIEIDSFTLTVN